MEKEQYQGPTWDEYFMEIAHTISQRATCDRGRSGCVIARDQHILVTGYVGSPRGCRMTPCRTCAMLIINCGIERVVCKWKYHDEAESEEMFRQDGILLEFVHDEIQEYKKQ